MLSRSFFHLRERNKRRALKAFRTRFFSLPGLVGPYLSTSCLSLSFSLLLLFLLVLLLNFFSSVSHDFSIFLSLSLVNIPTTELSTPTVYLLLAMHLDRLIRSRSSRPGEIERKAHLPRSFMPILWRVNSRNREKERT